SGIDIGTTPASAVAAATGITLPAASIREPADGPQQEGERHGAPPPPAASCAKPWRVARLLVRRSLQAGPEGPGRMHKAWRARPAAATGKTKLTLTNGKRCQPLPIGGTAAAFS